MPRPGRRGRLALGVVAATAVVLAAVWVAWREPAADPSATGADATADAPVAGTMPTDQPTPPSVPPVEEIAADPPAEQTGGDVLVALTFAGWEKSTAAVEASGFVGGVVEAGGTCRLSLTRGARSAVAEIPGEPDATTTVCGTVSVPREQLSEGAWQAVLSYESASSSGVSAPVEVEVPAR